MKSLLIVATLMLSAQAFSGEQVVCRSEITIQAGSTQYDTDAEISFNLNRDTKALTQFKGHIFVKSDDDAGPINEENAYMGFFKASKLETNPKYRPIKYKGWSQYSIDASETKGREDGMWGDLVVDLTKKNNFEARYIFKAGDHMGGTVLFTCNK